MDTSINILYSNAFDSVNLAASSFSAHIRSSRVPAALCHSLRILRAPYGSLPIECPLSAQGVLMCDVYTHMHAHPWVGIIIVIQTLNGSSVAHLYVVLFAAILLTITALPLYILVQDLTWSLVSMQRLSLTTWALLSCPTWFHKRFADTYRWLVTLAWVSNTGIYPISPCHTSFLPISFPLLSTCIYDLLYLIIQISISYSPNSLLRYLLIVIK